MRRIRQLKEPLQGAGSGGPTSSVPPGPSGSIAFRGQKGTACLLDGGGSSSVPLRISSGPEAKKARWGSFFGGEDDKRGFRKEPIRVLGEKLIETDRWGLVSLPAIIECLSVAAMEERNYPFYNSPSSLKGMDRSTWPTLLMESLDAEEALIKTIMEGGTENEAFIELGCGTGKYLPLACRHFGRVIGADFSLMMLQEAAKNIAMETGSAGTRKTMLALVDMTDVLPFISSKSVDLAVCAFNTQQNLEERRRFRMMEHLKRVLKPSQGGKIYPYVFSFYEDNPETRKMQEEFYENMGLKVITSENDAAKGFSLAEAPDGSILKSQRVTPQAVIDFIRRNGMKLEGSQRLIQLSHVMYAAIAYVDAGERVERAEASGRDSAKAQGSAREGVGAQKQLELAFSF
jgi:SAM-dependent methyltransferase